MDEYFIEAARFVIRKDKASIGMLQHVFKIGFNRAHKIMDELCEMGVVGEETGTKPREILMDLKEFENSISSGILEEKLRKRKEEESNAKEEGASENDLKNTCMIMCTIILETYKSFGVFVSFVNFRFGEGNAIFGIIPNVGVRVKTVMSYEKDLSLRLGAEVKMKLLNGYIGIFMPIAQFKIRMGSMLKDDRFAKYYNMFDKKERENDEKGNLEDKI